MPSSSVPSAASAGVLEFLQAIWAVEHSLQSRSKRMARVLGVTGPQRFVLRLVRERPGVSPTDLALLLRAHKSTLTDVVGRLEARGFLTRRSSADDGRRMHLVLTRRGEAICKDHPETIESVAKDVLAVVSERDRAATLRVLDAFEVALRQVPAARTKTAKRPR